MFTSSKPGGKNFNGGQEKKKKTLQGRPIHYSLTSSKQEGENNSKRIKQQEIRVTLAIIDQMEWSGATT